MMVGCDGHRVDYRLRSSPNRFHCGGLCSLSRPELPLLAMLAGLTFMCCDVISKFNIVVIAIDSINGNSSDGRDCCDCYNFNHYQKQLCQVES